MARFLQLSLREVKTIFISSLEGRRALKGSKAKRPFTYQAFAVLRSFGYLAFPKKLSSTILQALKH